MTNEAINIQEAIKASRKQSIEDFNYQGMTSEEIVEAMLLEKEQWESERLEEIAEDDWQAWNGNPRYLSREERNLNEVALDHEAIEMSLTRN